MNLTEAKLISKLLSTNITICDSDYGELYELGSDDKEELILDVLKDYLEEQ